MLKYTVKRLAQSLVTILLIATIVFLLMRCLPTDYYFTEEQLMKFTEEQKYAALEAAGLTDPIGTQLDRKSTRLNSSHIEESRMPSSA